MQKVVLTIAIASMLCFGHIAMAEEHTVTLGYAHSKLKDFKNINGFNVKYHHKGDRLLGIITSLSHMSGSSENVLLNNDKVDTKYYSFAAGPIYQLNDDISIYGLLGSVLSDVKHNYQTKKTYYSASETKLSMLYGVGIQANLTNNFVFDLAYEGTNVSYFGNNNSIKGFNFGIGYRF